VTTTIQALDLSPLDDLTAEDRDWLERLQRHVAASKHLLRLGDASASDDGEDHIVSRDAFGRWWTGRYIGEVSLEGRRLEIRPRLGDVVIEQWLGEILNLVAIPETAARQKAESFIARLMGAVWCRAVDQASRHGPPSFRRDHTDRGQYIRGRLDVRGTARLRASGSPHVASTQSYRDLDNDVSRTLVAAERALSSRIGHHRWLTPRVDEMMPWLRASVGARPHLPTQPALTRIRYTPITQRYRSVAELSWRLARLQGYSAASTPDGSEGLLIDVAELWELFVVKATARALPTMRVEHGTRAGETTWLLSSRTDPHAGLGRLKPDILAFKGGKAYVVADAKYKRLENRRERPQGIDRADLYQLTSYLARYSPKGEALGLLVYPRGGDDWSDAQRDEESQNAAARVRGHYATAEAKGPWRLQAGGDVQFVRLSVNLAEAVVELSNLVEPIV
jgi:5-methylcytosine-specific restriction enzyme subunit McrC